jgi:predicted nucleotidyltransferase
MGTSSEKTYGLGEALFSKTQRKILGLLFGHPDNSYFAKEIYRLAGVGIGAAHRELDKLTSVGLLNLEHVGNQKHYSANKNSPIYGELRGIVQKTFGLADVLRGALSGHVDKISQAFIYGSVAKETDRASSDIDVLIISNDLSYSDALSLFDTVEPEVGRKVSPTIYTPAEFENKWNSDNNFIKRIIDQPKIFLIGSEDDILTSR